MLVLLHYLLTSFMCYGMILRCKKCQNVHKEKWAHEKIVKMMFVMD